MTTAINEYQALVAQHVSTEGVSSGQMFGKACLKVGGKAFMAQHLETVVFKLAGKARETAMKTKGAALWDPSGKGRPMKEWVALPVGEAGSFKSHASSALAYVSGKK